MPANETANPNCHACRGTGVDTAFGSTCTECWIDANRNQLVAARYQGIEFPDSTLPRNGAGYDARTRRPTVKMASDKQIAYLLKLLAERQGGTDDQRQMWARIEAASDHPMTSRAASDYIDALCALPRRTDAAATPAPARTNRYAGRCERCGETVPAQTGTLNKVDGRWVIAHVECPEAPAVAGVDLRSMERFTSKGLVRVAVPGGDTRLKLRIKFARNGSIYVDDAAEYGEGRNYGVQRQGQSYRGDVTDELTKIVADPQAAIVAYTELVGRCGICNRHLEDKTSVARGIGPVCAEKLGIG